MTTIQLGGVIVYFGITGKGGQGRYLFPVLPAILTLLWLGWCRWFGTERPAAVGFVAAAAALNLTAWTVVALRVYR